VHFVVGAAGETAGVQNLWHVRRARVKSRQTRVHHRRVHEVAHAGHKDAGNQRLRHQKEQATVDRQMQRRIAHLVRAETPETIGVSTSV
jgi:hypothetical protein